MAAKGSTSPALVWNWVVEALASSEQANASTLIGLVNTAPAISGDAGKDARELVSLRILENLFAHGKDTDADSAQNCKISFDASERCEDVLNKILHKTPEPMLKLEQEKWDVRPFLMHKRSSMPTCLLMKLKEAMLESSNPLLLSLKEKSRISNASEDVSLDKDDPSLNISKDKNKVQENVLPEMDHVQSSVGGTIEHAGIEDDTNLTKDGFVSNDPRKETNIAQEKVSQGADQEENSSGGSTRYARLENCEMFIERPPEGSGGNQMTEDGADANILRDDDHLPRDTYTEGHDKRVSVDSMEGSEFVITIQQNSERDDDKRTDIAAEKEAFMKSQFTITEWSEIDLCMKCNEGGQLLVCSSDACVIRVHESCLGSSVTLDESDKFFCPFCAYSRAISKCLEAKRKVSLARKDLQAFTSFSVNHMLNKSSVKQSELQKKGTESFPATTEGNGVGHTASRANDINCKSNEQTTGIWRVSDEMRIETECLNQQTTGLPQNPIPEPSTLTNNCKRKETQSSTEPSCSRKLRKKKGQHTPPVPLHSLRRNKLPWAKTEEEILEEGVQRYASANNKGIPWKEILDFGRNVFHKGRTTIDLKDKWRNMCLNQQTTGLPQNPIPEPSTLTKNRETKETQSSTEPSCSTKLRNKKAQHTPPVPLHSLRRNKLPWAKTEEEILKEGVQRYASANDKGIPWKEILDFGRNVFHKGRTTIDLKDKWRNMCKGNTNVK
uniref:Zinc finger, PHD-type, homeodomain-like, zinc finger, RING/FYVE/PHD-type n=1 Tax=Tanacetum cinerariifolium TaxID=118510 RepID=A0A6L2P3U4_TANCI|nr:zinc finger, PHD-type, homeodomain-like, zinc finger, RING/FYVE/PHD-type [Tanacetum cinerariifolium]